MKVQTDPNFIAIKRFDFDIEKLIERYPDGCPNRIIAQALLITEDDIDLLYSHIIRKLKAIIDP
jgi:hypothetical protein